VISLFRAKLIREKCDHKLHFTLENAIMNCIFQCKMLIEVANYALCSKKNHPAKRQLFPFGA
jgi:hypothetical protein